MTPKEKLQSLLAEQYISEDGEPYRIELLKGLTEEQINHLAALLPNRQIPAEIKELLRFAGGFTFPGLDDITFDGAAQFGFENFFPHSIQLAGDGFGNFWILDVDEKGNWGNVFFVCHDPAVIVKPSDNLTQFIEHIHAFGKYGNDSELHLVHEKIVWDIWEKDNGLVQIGKARQADDPVIKNFALSLDDHFMIADLRAKPNKSGFAWGKFGPNTRHARRHGTELIWAVERPVKKGFFEKLFSK